MWEFFNKNSVQCNLQKGDTVYLPPARSSCYGIDSLAFGGSLLRNSLPSNVKQSHNLEEFKLKLKNLGNIHCTLLSMKLIQGFNFLSVMFFNVSFVLYVLYLNFL